MAIPAPILDDRSYQQLRDELIRRIPVYTPEWTDHNASDPGITLIELFAFLGENLLFRFNQIPEATRLAYLRLLRIPLRPAHPSRALVTMMTENLSAIKPYAPLVPLSSELKAGDVAFETLNEVLVWPVSVIGLGRTSTPEPNQAKEPDVHEYFVRAIDALGGLKPGDKAVPYRTQRVSVDEPPVDFGAAVDGHLWIAVLQSKGSDLTKMSEGLLNIGFIPDAVVPSIDQVEACPGAEFVAKAPPVEWQISVRREPDDGEPRYERATVEGDTTRGLSQQGIVQLRLPPSGFGVFRPADADLLGTGDRPPALDDESENKLLFWLRAFRLDGSRFGKVRLVGINAVETRQTKRAGAEFVGTGNAQPNQIYLLSHKPILERSLQLEVEEAGGWKPWHEVDGFHASEPEDHHFVVNREDGTVQFGNGVRGFPPQIGQRIRAIEYRYGGGAAGNVGAKAINKLTDDVPVKVLNPLPAIGGEETEDIASALDRIPGELRRRDRAVTADDFRELALAVPGANVGRAECLPRFHPPSRTEERPGIVTVVVWPKEDKANPNAPRPDRDLLRAVCTYLDARRLVATELYVIPPTYRKIAVAVGLKVKDGYGVEAVRRWVELVLRQYLAPLPPYGPDGNGWPLGRRVHGPELEAAVLQVEGVEYLEETNTREGLELAGWDDARQAWVKGTVQLALFEVPELAEIRVVEGPLTFEPGDVVKPPATEGVPVPIPILREEC